MSRYPQQVEVGTSFDVIIDVFDIREPLEAVVNYRDDVFICLETAMTDEIKIRLADQTNVKTL